MVLSGSGKAVVVALGDDMKKLCQTLTQGLSDRGVTVTGNLSAAGSNGARIVTLVSSTVTPELLSTLRSLGGNYRTVAVLGGRCRNNWDALVKLMRHGAQDVLVEDHCDIIAELSGRIERWFQIDSLIEREKIFERAIGRSQRWVDVVRRVVEVAHFTNDTVLLYGASGTGKDLLARLIHDLDRRPNLGSYVILDCTAIVPTLAESSFFGHERGAFTGAFATREGVFAEADRGTLFLDEIGDLPLPLQAQLLRVIQEGTYRRIGSNVFYQSKFRLVCATNKNLMEEVEAGRFRRDLYYRIAQWTFDLPSLTERTEDIPLLASHFLRIVSGNRRTPVYDALVQSFLCTRPYPGNVRELRLLVERLCILKDKAGVISAGCIPADEWNRMCLPLREAPSNGSHAFIRNALDRSFGLEEIAALARFEAIKRVMAEQVEQIGSDPSRRAEVLRQTARRLKCSLRWIQKCNKDHTLFQSLGDSESQSIR